jgi:DNA-binding response OmpR family regulator
MSFISTMHNPSDEHAQFVTLLAYDNSSRLQIQELQASYGYTLVLTDSRVDTSKAITNKLFGLIIFDVALVGFELISTAKSTDCINCHTPIIALIDVDDSSHRRNCIAAGFDDCLVKPLTADKLHETIRFWRENDTLTVSTNAIQALLTKTRNNHKLVLTLFNKLYEEFPQQIAQLELALKTAQYQLAFDITHKLNGSAVVCCLDNIAIPATTLEKCLLQKSYEDSAGHFFVLKQRVSSFLNHKQPIDDLSQLIDKQ